MRCYHGLLLGLKNILHAIEANTEQKRTRNWSIREKLKIEKLKIGLANHPPCSLVAELRGRSSTWPSRRHTRAPLAAPIRLMSGHGAQPRSNQGWFLWREENRRTRRKTLEAQERTNKLNSHMIPGLGIELGTIVVRGEHSHHCATRAPLILPVQNMDGIDYYCFITVKRAVLQIDI